MYMEIDEGFVGNKKTLRFCGFMKDPDAIAYLIRLWSWAVRSAPDGDLSQMEPREIEIAVQYRKLDGACYRAMAKAGFIDESVDGVPWAIHNWSKRTGAAIKRMDAEAKRKKFIRLHQKGECDPETCPHKDHGTVRRMSGGQAAGRPPTDQSSPVKTSPVPPKSPPAGSADPPWSTDRPETPEARAARMFTSDGITWAIRREVERLHPEVGMWNPGYWAGRALGAFLDAIGPERRTPALAAEIEGRIRAFAASEDPRVTKGRKWTVEAFCENYTALAPAAPPARPRRAPPSDQIPDLPPASPMPVASIAEARAARLAARSDPATQETATGNSRAT